MSLQTSISEVAAGLQCQLAGTQAGLKAGYDQSPPAKCHTKLAPVPDLDNRRFCRACQTTLPVDCFPPGKRRYLCRRHTWLHVKKPSKERVLADPRKKLLSILWKQCWNDAKTTFGHARIALLQSDIAGALLGLDSGRCLKTVQEEPAIAILPANPAQLLSRDNHVVVELDARRNALRAYRKGGTEQYKETLGRFESILPPRACHE